MWSENDLSHPALSWEADPTDHINFLNLWLPFACSWGKQEGGRKVKLSTYSLDYLLQTHSFCLGALPQLPLATLALLGSGEYSFPLTFRSRGGNGFLLLLALGYFSISNGFLFNPAYTFTNSLFIKLSSITLA